MVFFFFTNQEYQPYRLPALCNNALYWRQFLKWWGYSFLILLGIDLVTDLSAKRWPSLLVASEVAIAGGLMLSLFISAVTWLMSFTERFIDRKICFCKDHIWHISTAGTARLKYEDIWLCRFRTMTLGEQQIDVIDIQTAEGFITIEINPSVVLRQKQITVG